MRGLLYTIFILSLLTGQGCSEQGVYNARVKTLDSLGGALNAMLIDLARTDTVLLHGAIERYRYYTTFIRQQVNDTLSRPEADQLLKFQVSGGKLEDVARNLPGVVARATLINSQLAKLADDARSRLLSTDDLTRYTLEEKQAGAELIEAGYTEKRNYQQHLGEFKNSVMNVEALIKRHNNGQLPTIVKDSINR